ncbi:hypothetical protein B0T16DRAFT_452594 [Cercophora newfieldiana]|uniref:Uncharacterized protein n=1 Tax=Cercophora newfieldiana TaxID=92897 RepID=A0AA39YR36_9PEZI|nr:hypothetical protein B0T16DRAFT_452594 [Cercophora newfieldiana]
MERFIPRSLAILTRASENSGSDIAIQRPSQLSTEGDVSSGAPSPSSSRRRASQASTPPQDDESPSHGEMINGFGGLFDNVPLPRASILTMGSESASVASTATCSRRSQTPEIDENSALLVTPKVSQQEWAQHPILTITPKADQDTTPTRTMSTRACIVVQPLAPTQLNLVTPDPSPRVAKRPASPPLAPRQAKRSRSQAQQVLGSFLLDDDLENPLGPRSRKIAKARQRGAELAVASASDTSSQTPSDLETRSREQSEGGDVDDTVGLARSLSELESPIKIRNTSFPELHSSAQFTSEQGSIALEIEWFTEAEIEAQLSTLLVSYRAFYLESVDPSDERHADAGKARIARKTLMAIFEGRLSPGEDEGLLLQEDEEDAMKLFMTHIKEMGIPSTPQTETFPNVRSCLNRMIQLGTAPGASGMDSSWQFVRKMTLLMDFWPSQITDDLPVIREIASPTQLPDGALTWDFERIYCGVDAENLGPGWDDLASLEEENECTR